MNRHIPRRLFLGGAVSALSLLKTGVASYADPDGKAGVGNDSGPGGCSDPPSQLAEGKNRGWIDAHVHVWTPDVKRYPIDTRNFSVADMVPPSFTPQQLMAECQPSGVDRVVLIQMSFYNHDNSYMLDVIKKYRGVFSGVGIVDHQANDLIRRIKDLSGAGVRGFRISRRGAATKTWLNDPGMAKLWDFAGRHGLSICPLINPSDFDVIDKLCVKFPETRVVIDHFGRVGITGEIVPAQLDALCKLARHQNVHVKTSAFYALGKKQPPYKDLLPMLRRVVDSFSPQRLMWASDCPYQVQGQHDYQSSIDLIGKHLDTLSKTDRQWILRDTAEKVFFSKVS
jgi:predicted TIM-barrel fold metal-dependent hydrolase